MECKRDPAGVRLRFPLAGSEVGRWLALHAIVRDPKVFLLDEPLSNLDAKLRAQMRTEISKLHKKLQTTFIYVTHDQTEAMTMGTRIVVMKDGVIQQVDSPQYMYDHPTNIFVAGFIGSPQMNFMDSKCAEKDGKVIVTFGEDIITLPEKDAKILKDKGYIGKEIILGIRPEDIDDDVNFMAAHKDTIVSAKVEVTELMGAETYLYLLKDKHNLTVRVNGTSSVKPGDTIKLALDENKIHVFDKETELTVI